ncbi:UNVERIFIED_CONTAM: hypothetical protein FKN15_037651 [Acipenser sinensis]
MAVQGSMAIAMRLRNQLQSVYKLDPLRNEVQILFNNESLPDHMTMKQLWLSRWFGKSNWCKCNRSANCTHMSENTSTTQHKERVLNGLGNHICVIISHIRDRNYRFP